MSLNDIKIRSLKPTDKLFKTSDSHGLYPLVKSGGSCLRYLKYRINGEESRIILGTYPAVSLSDARQQREGIRKMLALNINPAQQRAAERGSRMQEKMFESVVLEWRSNKKKWLQNTVDRVLARLNRYVFPTIGHLPATELKSCHFIELLKDIEGKGLFEVASRSWQRLSNTIRYAVRQGLIEINPTAGLDGVAASPAGRHYPTLSLERPPELPEQIDSYHQGRKLARLAVLLTLHVFIRPSELRYARWIEINFRNRIQTIPTAREATAGVRYSNRGVKMRTPYIASLPEQVVSTLKRIKEISGGYGLVFPGYHDPYKPMSGNIINKALRQMGHNTKQDVCGHGFRTMVCSALMESGLRSQDAAKRQMSHQERDTMRLVYIHKAEHVEARVDMMQWWSDYLDMCSETWVPSCIWSQQNINLVVT